MFLGEQRTLLLLLLLLLYFHDHDMSPGLRTTKLTANLYTQSSLQQIDTRYVTKTPLIDRWL
jgi:hypothetical protein